MAHRVGANGGRKRCSSTWSKNTGGGKRRAGANGERTRKAGRGEMRPALPFLSAYPGFGVELCGAFTELELQDVVVAYDAELLAC